MRRILARLLAKVRRQPRCYGLLRKAPRVQHGEYIVPARLMPDPDWLRRLGE